MKRNRFRLYFWMGMTAFTAVFFLYGQTARTRVHDLMALNLIQTDRQDYDASIIATDITYNWARDCLMFSMEVTVEDGISSIIGTWTVTGGTDSCTVTGEPVTVTDPDAVYVLTGTVKRKDFDKGENRIHAEILDENGNELILSNRSDGQSGILLFSLISD